MRCERTERNSLFLTAAEIHALFADFSHIARGQGRKVGCQRAGAHNTIVTLGVKLAAIEDIVAGGRVLRETSKTYQQIGKRR